jgi:hypothetical protein
VLAEAVLARRPPRLPLPGVLRPPPSQERTYIIQNAFAATGFVKLYCTQPSCRSQTGCISGPRNSPALDEPGHKESRRGVRIGRPRRGSDRAEKISAAADPRKRVRGEDRPVPARAASGSAGTPPLGPRPSAVARAALRGRRRKFPFRLALRGRRRAARRRARPRPVRGNERPTDGQ